MRDAASVKNLLFALFGQIEVIGIWIFLANWSITARNTARIKYDIDPQESKVSALRIILMALAFISLQAHAKDGRNLANNTVNEKRIALVIGNSKYSEKPLSNTANDARDMAAALRELGFDVSARIDVTQKDLNRAIAQFGEKLNANTIALFYYAGHGMQVRGKITLSRWMSPHSTVLSAGQITMWLSKVCTSIWRIQ